MMRPEKVRVSTINDDRDALAWDQYVLQLPQATGNHLTAWRRVIGEAFVCFFEEVRICVVSQDEVPLAAAFLYGFRRALEIPWTASDKRYTDLSANMLLNMHASMAFKRLNLDTQRLLAQHIDLRNNGELNLFP